MLSWDGVPCGQGWLWTLDLLSLPLTWKINSVHSIKHPCSDWVHNQFSRRFWVLFRRVTKSPKILITSSIMASCVDEISPLVAPLCTRFRSRIQNSLIYDRNVFRIPVAAQAVNKPNRSSLAMLGSATQPTPWAKFIKTNWFSPISPLKQIVKSTFNKSTGLLLKNTGQNWSSATDSPLCACMGQCLVLVPTTLGKQEADHRSTKHSHTCHWESYLLSTWPSLPVSVTVTILTSNMFFCFFQFWEKSHIKKILKLNCSAKMTCSQSEWNPKLRFMIF